MNNTKTQNSQKWFILFAMCLAMFTVCFNTTSVANAAVAIQNEFNLSPVSLSWIINVYLLAAASLVIVGGQLGDRIGRQYTFYMGCTLFIVASLFIALSHGFLAMIIGRTLQGASIAFVAPSTLILIKHAFPKNLENFGMSMWSAAVGLGFAVGPTSGGLLTSFLSWRYIFWINIPLMLTALLITFFKNNCANVEKKRLPLDPLGLVLFIAGMLPFILGLIKGNSWGWDNPWTLGLLITGGLLLTTFWFVEVRTEHPLVQFAHFKKRHFLASVLGMSTTMLVLMSVLFFMNLYLQSPVLLHYSALKAGVALLPLSIAMFLTSFFLSAKVMGRFTFQTIITTSFACLSAAFLFLGFTQASSTYWHLWPALIVFGVGVGITFSASPALGMRTLGEEKSGQASGILNTTMYVGGVLAVSLCTSFFHHAGARMSAYLMPALPLTILQKGQLHNVLAGHDERLQPLLRSVSEPIKQGIIKLMQASHLASFSSVMFFCGIICSMTAITCFFLMKERPSSELSSS